MSDFLKYLCVCALAYLGLQLYVAVLAFVLWLLLPPGCYPDLGIDFLTLPALLQSAWRSSAILALLIAPLLGIAVVRGANGACEQPGDERSWWRHAHRALAMNLGAAVVAGLVMTIFALIWSAVGDDPQHFRIRLGRAVYLGMIVGVVIVSLGAAMRAFGNAPDE